MSVPTSDEIVTFSRLEKIYNLVVKSGDDEFSPDDAFPEVPRIELWRWTEIMDERGLLRDEGTMQGLHSITGMGRNFVEDAISKRDDVALFRATVRSRLLRWAYNHSNGPDDHVGVQLDQNETWFYGREISLNDLARAAKELEEKELLWQKPLGSAAESILHLLVGITHKGQECVEEFHGDINEYLKSKREESKVASQTINIQNQYGGNASIGNKNSLVSIVGEAQTEKVVELGKAMREALPLLGFNEDQEKEALTHISHLEEASSPDEVKKGLEGVKKLAKTAGTGALSTMLAGLAEELIKTIFGG